MGNCCCTTDQPKKARRNTPFPKELEASLSRLELSPTQKAEIKKAIQEPDEESIAGLVYRKDGSSSNSGLELYVGPEFYRHLQRK